jgi:hypothetical protein
VGGKPPERIEIMPPAYPFPTPLPVVPGGYLVRAIGTNTASGTPSSQQFGFTISGITPQPSATQVAAAFGVAWRAHMLDVFHPSYESQQIGCISLATATTVEEFVPALGAGTSTGVAAPPNITALARFTTLVRRKRGHIHVSPISDFSIAPDGNHVTDAYALLLTTRLQSTIGDFIASPGFAGGLVTHCVISKITNKLYDGRLIPVSGVFAETNLGSQRRRRGY